MALHNHGTIADKYVASAYFTIIGLSTVGFGDITPANDLERFYSIMITLLGALIFAIVIGTAQEIAQQVRAFIDVDDCVHDRTLYLPAVAVRVGIIWFVVELTGRATQGNH